MIDGEQRLEQARILGVGTTCRAKAPCWVELQEGADNETQTGREKRNQGPNDGDKRLQLR